MSIEEVLQYTKYSNTHSTRKEITVGAYKSNLQRHHQLPKPGNADARTLDADGSHLRRDTPVQLLLVQARRGDDLQRRGHEGDEPGRLHHTHVLGPGPLRQRPPEVVQHVADHGRHEVDPELRAGAHQ